MRSNQDKHPAPRRCLLIRPAYTLKTLFNYQKTCEVFGARYPTSPLGLIIVAAMLPQSWEVRLVDCNIEELNDEDIRWADLVMSSWIVTQRQDFVVLSERLKQFGKTHVVGGPDVTTSPDFYDRADTLILGEAEVTLPAFLEDCRAGNTKHVYDRENQWADLTDTIMPRFDLLKTDKYLQVGMQFSRGCPHRCEFCNIADLFGRTPRSKTSDQILSELDRIYELGHRGMVDFLDDNFISSKKSAKTVLGGMREWQKKHNYPFEFSTEITIAVADDDELLEMMRDAGFYSFYIGVESPDHDILNSVNKAQNTRRPIAESIQRIHRYGIQVSASWVIGFDSETGSVAEDILQCIEDAPIPVNKVNILAPLPGTPLAERLAKEGRVDNNLDALSRFGGGECVVGPYFKTRRPEEEVVDDHRRVLSDAYDPRKYFRRLTRTLLQIDFSEKKLALHMNGRELRGLFRFMALMGFRGSYKRYAWKMLSTCLLRQPKALRYAVANMAFYLHARDYVDHLYGSPNESL